MNPRTKRTLPRLPRHWQRGPVQHALDPARTWGAGIPETGVVAASARPTAAKNLKMAIVRRAGHGDRRDPPPRAAAAGGAPSQRLK